MGYKSVEHELDCMRHELQCLSRRVISIEEMLEEVLCLLKADGRASDLAIKFGSPIQRSPQVANKKATGNPVNCPCLCPKGGGMRAVMPDVTFTDPAPKSITLQPLNGAGAAVLLTPADVVTGTLVSSSPNFVISAGTDSVNWVGTIPANTPFGSTADLSATLKGTIQGSPADFTATIHLIINIPPSPVAVDLAIVFA